MKVEVIGGSLTAAIFASQCAFEGIRTRLLLPEQSPLVSSWKAVEFLGHGFDNGYHGVDFFRSPNLVELLMSRLRLNLVTDERESGVLWRKLIGQPSDVYSRDPFGDAMASLATSPASYFDFEEMERLIPLELLESLKVVSRRYSSDWAVAKHFFLPWFLPSSVLVESTDEGDVHRNLVRAGLFPPTKMVPKQMPFESLGQEWLARLEEIDNLEIDSGPISGSASNKPRVSDKRVRFALTVLEVAGTGIIANYSEVLALIPEFPEISRISSHTRGNREYLMLESFHSSESNESFQKKWLQFIQEVNGVEILAHENRVTRVLPIVGAAHRPKYNLEISPNLVKVNFSSGGPINMAKASALAMDALRDVVRVI